MQLANQGHDRRPEGYREKGAEPWHRNSGTARLAGAAATLYQIGYLTALHCPDCTRVYVQARQRGLATTLAIIHVANKANRILFALLTSQEPYRSPLSDEEAAYWRRQLTQLR